MKNPRILFFLPLAFLLFSCSHDQHSHAGGAVQLNKGQKWMANPETTEGIAKMQTLVEMYLTRDSADIKTLRSGLETEFSTIFAKCTMEGEAHEQLHNYLLPLKDKLKALDEQAGTHEVEAIKAYLFTFSNYFE